MVEFEMLKGKGLSVSFGKKNIAVNPGSGTPVLEVTNEYGNSVRYEISDAHRFDALHASLWQFVKDSQH